MLPQTKVPIHGGDRINSLKVLAMKQAKDRIKQLARLGPASNLDLSPHSLDKLEPEFVSEEEITKMLARLENWLKLGGSFWGNLSESAVDYSTFVWL